ncbi:MAG: ribonuclease H-like domain-containing protein [Candidatus Lokiarchaeota archaeon]|nr:ribonuclease H-like domain-containing protein [Candidatus Lokiarchaeota archaeon]
MRDTLDQLSFDVSQLVEKYQGKKLYDFFQNYDIRSNSMGEFMEFSWIAKDFVQNIDLNKTKAKILFNLKVALNIGEKIEIRLKQRGLKSLRDLTHSLKYRCSALDALRLIRNNNHEKLMHNRYICDLDVAFCFKLEDLLFIDIETLGIFDSPLIIVGVGYFRDLQYEIRLFFARTLEEEISICEHLRNEVFPRYKCFVSYNGKSFDIPFIANRFLYFFDENPMIHPQDMPYKESNTLYHHIDLYHNCRRKYKGLFDSFSLTNMEENLLGFYRTNELPSNLVGACYKKYLENPERYIGLVKECIEHNYYDVYSLPLILEKLL